ncbi:MAG: glycosyltransferase family 4 protein [Tetrasphaera sp.]
MKIAMIGLRGLPASYGGVEKHVEEIGWRLAADGHQVTVYCRPNYSADDLTVPADYNYEPPVGRTPGRYRGVMLRNLPTPGGKHLESTVHSGLSAIHTLRRRYDIVHFHAMGPGLFTPIPKLLSSATVVQTVHGLDDERAKWSLPARSMLRLGRSFSTFVPDEVIVVSRDLARIYEQLHGRAATYIPNGAPKVTPIPPGPTLERFGLRPGYGLFLGRLVPEKQPDMLLRAFARVPGDTQLVVVGDSSNTDAYAEEVRALAAADPRVVLTGYLYGQALAEVMSSAGVFVQPSKLEGMPITLLEAAAYGLRVVVSDIAPHLEVVHRSLPGTRVFGHDSTADLAAALRAELADPDAGAANAAALRAEVRSKFDWDVVTDQVLSVYRRSLAG